MTSISCCGEDRDPMGIQLRRLLATEKNSTVIFPLPIELMQEFLNRAKGGSS